MGSIDEVYYEALVESIHSLARDLGFDSIESAASHALAERTIEFFEFLAGRSRAMTELSGRLTVGAMDMLLILESTTDLAKVNDFMASFRPTQTQPVKIQHVRSASPIKASFGPPASMPPTIPSFLPPFPSAHTFVKSAVQHEPETSYSQARHLDASNRRAIQNSLIRFKINSNPRICLFRQEYDQTVEDATREMDKLQAERLARRNDPAVDAEDTINTLIFRHIPPHLFVLAPFAVEDPYAVALCPNDDDPGFDDDSPPKSPNSPLMFDDSLQQNDTTDLDSDRDADGDVSMHA